MTGSGNWYFEVLGPLRVNCDGERIELARSRPRLLLGLLLAHCGQPMSVDRLANELWDEHPPASAASALHVHLSKLRSIVGDLLLKVDGGYQLDAGRLETDAARFSELVKRARTDPGGAGPLLAEALALWRGEPLGDMDANQTLDRWRDELAEQRLEAVILRVDADLTGGAGGGLAGELQRLVDAHPYEERLWEQLMLALYRAGRQAEALDTYQRVRTRLDDELGLEPGAPLRDLQAKILNHDPSLHAAPALTLPRPAAVPIAPARRRILAIPRPVTPTVGRDAELADLLELSRAPALRLITIVGDGGVGKTRLAIVHALRWSKDAFPDGAVFVSLAELSGADQVGTLIASSIARRAGGGEPTAQTLSGYLADRDMLLILDNFEHVLEASPLIAELLAAAPDLRILATSRTPLRLRGERLFELSPLPVSPAGEPGSGPAVDLFLQGASAVNTRFNDTGEARAQIATICRALDGLPLAIELAAARAGTLSVSQIESQLTNPLGVGAHALVDMPVRQQSLASTIRWSYELLSPAGQRALRAAACFRGSFTAEALAATAGDGPDGDVLADLLGANVVKRGTDPDRYRLLELVWAFARELVEQDPAETSQFRDRQCRYYVETYRSEAEAHNAGQSAEIARTLLPDRANLVAAVRHAIAARDADSSRALLFMLESIWTVYGGGQDEVATLITDAIDRCAFEPIDELLLLRIAPITWTFGSDEIALIRRYAERAEELGYPYESLDARMMLIAAALQQRDIPEALRTRDAIAALPDLPEDKPRGRSARRLYLSQCAYVEGDFVAAAELADQTLEPVRQGPHAHSRAISFMWSLFAHSARDGRITRAGLALNLESAREADIVDLGIIALWDAARYAAAIQPSLARRWLADADRFAAEIGFGAWPEDELRREALALLGVEDTAALQGDASRRSLPMLLDEAIAWLAERPAEESVPRTPPAHPQEHAPPELSAR